MVYRGQVKDGVVVLDEPADLPEGTRVEVATLPDDQRGTTLGERLMRHAGVVKGMPSDLAINHDHYLYGGPKNE